MTIPEYRVRAVNTAADHENRIHSDEVAARYGFRGGLVPGVNVYGYLTVPVIGRLGREWLERGWMNVRFREPFYENEDVVVAAEVKENGVIAVSAGRASAEAGLQAEPAIASEGYRRPAARVTVPESRPGPSRELIFAGAPLGSFTTNLEEANARLVPLLGDPLECYREFAHPTVLLGLANEILVRNFVLPAWIHTSSEVRNFRAARRSESVAVRGVIDEAFTRKGHEFLVASIAVLAVDGELLTHVVHTAIWQPRVVE